MGTARRHAELGLVEVVQRLSLSRDLDGIVAVLRAATRELTGADGVTVILREGDYCSYVEENAIGPLWKGRRFPVWSCISGRCMTAREQIAIPDVYADDRIPHDLYRPTFVKSLVVTPIRRPDPIGAIGAYWSRPHAATDEELSTLQALADSAAVSFENVKLIQSLEAANRRKEEFLFMLAHELRNPLAPILNAVHVLRSVAPLGARGGWAADVIERQAGHMARLTDELLDTARIHSGKVRLADERLDLAALARDMIAEFRPLASSAGIEMEAAIPETGVWIRGDRARLEQVASNLIDNALKFTPAPGRMVVTVAVEGDGAVLRVGDTGIGIEPEFLPHVFESFAQADRSLERSRGGLGLGLTISRSLAEAQGGSLEARSDGPGRGAEFILRMPRDTEAAARAVPAAAPVKQAPARTLQVLVVEDNADAADSMKMLLEMVGHDVHVARTGTEGLDAARRTKPDIVLCDIGLPGLDGYGVARALRTDPHTRGIHLIAMTGYGEAEARQQAAQAGFDQHLTKPVPPEELIERLQRAAAKEAGRR